MVSSMSTLIMKDEEVIRGYGKIAITGFMTSSHLASNEVTIKEDWSCQMCC